MEELKSVRITKKSELMESNTEGKSFNLEEDTNDISGSCSLPETIFVDSHKSDEQIFNELKIKVESFDSSTEEDNELVDIGSTVDDEDGCMKKTRKKRKTGRDKVAGIRKLGKGTKQERRGRKARCRNPNLTTYKTVIDESGEEVKVPIEESLTERKRRLARDRMREKRDNMTEVEKYIAIRKQRIQKQKLRLRQRIEETEEEGEVRRKRDREQKRKSREKLKELDDSAADEDSIRCLSTSPKLKETRQERARRLGRDRQRRHRMRLTSLELQSVEDKLYSSKEIQYEKEAEDELELKKLRQKLISRQNRQQLQRSAENITKPSTSLKNSEIDLLKKKKRAPGDIEYLFFYENSMERRKRLDKDRRVAQYLARRQMELEYLDMEEECNTETSQRCLDID